MQQSPCHPRPGTTNALGDFFVEEFLDLNARDHRDGIPGALLGTNGTASANVPVDNDHLMRAIAGVIGVVDLIDTIDRTKVHAPFAPGAPINVNPGFRPRSTRPLRSLRHDSPATFLAHTWKHMCSYHAVVQCSQCSPTRLMFAVHSKALASVFASPAVGRCTAACTAPMVRVASDTSSG